jgi:hypothetical protein
MLAVGSTVALLPPLVELDVRLVGVGVTVAVVLVPPVGVAAAAPAVVVGVVRPPRCNWSVGRGRGVRAIWASEVGVTGAVPKTASPSAAAVSTIPARRTPVAIGGQPGDPRRPVT